MQRRLIANIFVFLAYVTHALAGCLALTNQKSALTAKLVAANQICESNDSIIRTRQYVGVLIGYGFSTNSVSIGSTQNGRDVFIGFGGGRRLGVEYQLQHRRALFTAAISHSKSSNLPKLYNFNADFSRFDIESNVNYSIHTAKPVFFSCGLGLCYQVNPRYLSYTDITTEERIEYKNSFSFSGNVTCSILLIKNLKLDGCIKVNHFSYAYYKYLFEGNQSILTRESLRNPSGYDVNISISIKYAFAW